MSFITQQLKEDPEEQLWAAKQDKPLCSEMWRLGTAAVIQSSENSLLAGGSEERCGLLQDNLGAGLGTSRWELRLDRSYVSDPRVDIFVPGT